MNTIKGCRTDFKNEKIVAISDDDIFVVDDCEEKFNYYTIHFKRSTQDENLVDKLSSIISTLLKNKGFTRPYHAFVVGLGNESYTADSIGPKTIKNIKVNSQLREFGLQIEGNIVSALEPGVLGVTGIDTKRIVESVASEIDPDIIILIDSFVTEDVDNLGRTIEIADSGINPGSGLKGANCEINYDTVGKQVITIGVATALEIKISSHHKSNEMTYLLSTNDVDTYVEKMSNIIAESLNRVFFTSE